MSGEVIEVLEFTCPDCGGHTFGSGMPMSMKGPFTEADFAEHMEGNCHGYFSTPREDRPCNFQWKRKDDAKYFKGTGKFLPRTMRGTVTR